MRDLILKALHESVKSYPELKQYLNGTAVWAAQVLEYKQGDPNEEARMRDERRLERKIRLFLEKQFARVKREIRKNDAQYRNKSIYQESFWNNEKDRMWDELASDFVGIILHGMDDGVMMLENAGGMVNPDLINQWAIDYGKQYRDEWLSKITDTSRKAVEKAVTDWLQSNESFDSLTTVLENTFSKVRSARIATTEVTRLRANANQMTWEESGVVDKFRWSTANDDLVCPICAPREGKTFPLSEMGNMLPAHVNCRCTGLPVINEEALYGEG